MSKRISSIVIKDILNCIDHLQEYTRDVDFDQFEGNFMMVEACLYNIQIIGEAVTHLPDDIKEKEQSIPWPLIKGMRNRLIHEYFGTDLPVVWNVIKNELPQLRVDLERIRNYLLEEGQ